MQAFSLIISTMSKASVWVIAFLLIGFFSCAPRATKVPPDPQALYSKAMAAFNLGRYTKAKELFSKFVGYFPEERELVARAELKMADCAFMRKDYPEARERYNEFLKRYPFHPDLPYCEYQLAMTYFLQIRSKDRDQESTFKALERFEELMRKYPDSIFAEKAKEKVTFCKRRLAEHELYVGRYYLQKKKYQAALRRFLAAWGYEGSGKEEEALYNIVLTYRKMGDEENALRWLETLRTRFPKSRYVKELGA